MGGETRCIATITTNLGVFKAELFNDRMPITCGNFIDLANDGFYDGIHIHRVIPRLLIQLGCPYARGDTASALCGTGAPPPYSQFRATDGRMMQRNGDGGIPDEMGDENAMVTDMSVSTDDYSSNVSQDPERHKISNLAGTLSMANTGQPDSGGSQFFINVGDNTFLDWFENHTPAAHPVFGQIVENYNLVLQISQVSTRNDNPVTPIKIISIRVK